MVVTLGQQYNVGEKPTVIRYTYINRHAGTPEKQRRQNNTSSNIGDKYHRWALWYLWNPWIMLVRGTPCTGTCDRPVGTLWVIEPCAYPVRVSVFSQGSCRAVPCLGVLPHACTLSKCAPLDYTQVCVALDFLCRCKRLHAVSPLWDCSGHYFPPVRVSFGWGRVYLNMHTIY